VQPDGRTLLPAGGVRWTGTALPGDTGRSRVIPSFSRSPAYRCLSRAVLFLTKRALIERLFSRLDYRCLFSKSRNCSCKQAATTSFGSVWNFPVEIGHSDASPAEDSPVFAVLERAFWNCQRYSPAWDSARALGAGNRCPGVISLLIARFNLHRWPSRRARCNGIESEIGSVLPGRAPSLAVCSLHRPARSFSLVIPVPRGEPVGLLLLLHASSLTHSDTRAEFRAISVHPGLGPTDIYQQRQRRERAIDR